MKKDCKQQWWKEAKYGLFIHWGLYSHLAGSFGGQELKEDNLGEWIMRQLNIPVADYEAIAKEFNPVCFNAAEWVGLAKDAGMKYIVFTAKHHDGFAMFHSECSKYNIVDTTPFRRDPVAELAVECKKADIKLCFYYSQAQDWHDPNGLGYGTTTDEEKNFRQYIDAKCKPQLKELLTKYGEIGLIWFDTPSIMTAQQSKELKDYVKSIQRDCIVSGRIGNQLGEYMSTGDNFIPVSPYEGDWEVPATLNGTWGFKSNDNKWKNPSQIIRLLLKINSRGGNYLLNIGPDGLGRIPKESIDILDRVGKFVKANAPAIYGTTPVRNYPYELDWCCLTSRDYHLYVNIFDVKKKSFHLPLFNSKVKKVSVLSTGEELEFTHLPVNDINNYHVKVVLPEILRDDICNTIDIEIEDKMPVFGSLDIL